MRPRVKPNLLLNLNISPSGLIFARHSELNNFGDNWGLNGGYTYQYSPQLNFHVSDVLGRQGQYRLGPIVLRVLFNCLAPRLLRRPLEVLSRDKAIKTFPISLKGDFLSFGIISSFRGDIFIDRMSVLRVVTQTISLIILDQGGTDIYQTIGFRGVYNWRKEHNLHAGVSVNIYNNRNSSNVNNRNNNNVVFNFDLGDDYFSNFQINLSPTLTLAASTGISLNAGNNGPPVANNTNITLTKIWETATLSGGVQHGLTSSYGVAGISNTTSVNGQFNYQVTEKLSTIAGVNFSLYDTDDGNFQTFQASAGARYQFTPWLASNFFYAYRWTDSSNSAASAPTSSKPGMVRANAVYLTLTANFDLWPNTGLSRSIAAPTPLVTTPFPQASSPTTPVSQPRPQQNRLHSQIFNHYGFDSGSSVQTS